MQQRTDIDPTEAERIDRARERIEAGQHPEGHTIAAGPIEVMRIELTALMLTDAEEDKHAA